MLFFICFLVAFTCWFFNTLSRTFTFEIKTPVEFVNLPEDQAVSFMDTPLVKITLKGNGWQFIFSRVNPFESPIQIDFSNLSDAHSCRIKPYAEEQLSRGLSILSLEPEQLHFSFKNKLVKKIPVVLRSALHFERQYSFAGKIVLKPDSIMISGPEEVISHVNSWPTELLSASELNSDLDEELDLVSGDFSNISLSSKNIQVHIPVDKFTEGELTVPIRVQGLTDKGLMKLYPASCKVFYQVALKNFQLVKPDQFDVYVQLDKKSGRQELMLNAYPKFVRFVHIEPKNINYVIYQ